MTGLNEIAGTVPSKAQSLFGSCFIETLASLAKSLVPVVVSASPTKVLARNGSILHMPLVPGVPHIARNCIVPQVPHLDERRPVQLEVGKACGLAPKRRLSSSSPFSVSRARQDASSRPPLSPLLWLWLPPDVTPLLSPPGLVADFVVSMYLSQLFSLAVKFMEFHTLLNHYSVSFFFMRGNIQGVVCTRVRGKCSKS